MSAYLSKNEYANMKLVPAAIVLAYFGFFVPLVKGQFSLAIKFFLVVLALDTLGSVIPVVGNVIAHILSSYGIARRYNKYYEDYLTEQGYIIQNAHSGFNTISRAKEMTRDVLKADSVGGMYNKVKKEYVAPKAWAISNVEQQDTEVKILCPHCDTPNDSISRIFS